jgi:para-nitrobenzyl esterase
MTGRTRGPRDRACSAIAAILIFIRESASSWAQQSLAVHASPLLMLRLSVIQGHVQPPAPSLASLPPSSAPAAANTSTLVVTAAGTLRGAQAGATVVFKGIQFGAPTGGTARFLPPVKPQPWAGVLDALAYGPKAPQVSTEVAYGNFPAKTRVRPDDEPMSEDCLRLNVWTPSTGGPSSRPVMVWFHGGGFQYGSGASSYFDGTNLAAKQDVVVVTVNSRLNVFGYLHLADLGDERFAGSANLGMQDKVASLEWIQNNIGAFGGDPGNVTIIGQSSGGGAVSTLMAMPAAQGLFHRAIVQSGTTVLKAISHEVARDVTATYLEKLGLKGVTGPALVDKLQSLSMEELSTAQLPAYSLRLGPVVDGKTLPSDPFDPTSPKLSAEIPLLIGATATETCSGDEVEMDDAALLDQMSASFGDDTAAAMIETYRGARPSLSNTDLHLELLSDNWIRWSMITQAERKAEQSAAPVYMYHFNWRSPVAGGSFRCEKRLH